MPEAARRSDRRVRLPKQDGQVSPRQYARLVDEWVTAIGLLREDYGAHSLCRTKTALIHKKTGNLRAVQILLDTKIETTVRYRTTESAIVDTYVSRQRSQLRVAKLRIHRGQLTL
jgi:hypothetical protein